MLARKQGAGDFARSFTQSFSLAKKSGCCVSKLRAREVALSRVTSPLVSLLISLLIWLALALRARLRSASANSTSCAHQHVVRARAVNVISGCGLYIRGGSRCPALRKSWQRIPKLPAHAAIAAAKRSWFSGGPRPCLSLGC